MKPRNEKMESRNCFIELNKFEALNRN